MFYLFDLEIDSHIVSKNGLELTLEPRLAFILLWSPSWPVSCSNPPLECWFTGTSHPTLLACSFLRCKYDNGFEGIISEFKMQGFLEHGYPMGEDQRLALKFSHGSLVLNPSGSGFQAFFTPSQ